MVRFCRPRHRSNTIEIEPQQEMQPMRTLILAPILALSLAAAMPAVADPAPGVRLNVPQADWLSPAQISEKLSGKGYRVTEIEVDDGAYEVDLVDKNGTKIEGHVHPATGELLMGYDAD
jgi:hypothetical protein